MYDLCSGLLPPPVSLGYLVSIYKTINWHSMGYCTILHHNVNFHVNKSCGAVGRPLTRSSTFASSIVLFVPVFHPCCLPLPRWSSSSWRLQSPVATREVSVYGDCSLVLLPLILGIICLAVVVCLYSIRIRTKILLVFCFVRLDINESHGLGVNW